MGIPISFHEVAKFLPSHPLWNTEIFFREALRQISEPIVHPRGKALVHRSCYANCTADYKELSVDGEGTTIAYSISQSNAPAPQAMLACVYPRRLNEVQPGLCWGWSCYCSSP
jgi:hypothetical protein